MEKASFVRLNKLFEITSNERNHHTLLSSRNLLAVIREPQFYILPIISRRLSKVVVPGEHYILKDLPFYEEAREADARACQECLDQMEEKRQDEKLRRAPGEKDWVSSSAACSSAKKKKSSAKVVKVLTSVPTSPSSSTLSSSTSMDSSIPDSKGGSGLPDFERSDSGPRHSEPEPIALSVINELEVDEGMMTDLRAGFKERHRKRLHEAIKVNASLTKRTCPEGEPMKDASLMLGPPPNVVGLATCRLLGRRLARLRMGHLAVRLPSRRIWIKMMPPLPFLISARRK